MNKWLYPALFSLLLILSACGGAENEEVESGEEVIENGENEEESGASEEEFEIAVIPAQSSGEMDKGLNKLEDTLNENMDREVKVEHYPNYNAVVEALNHNHIDLAFLGPLTYVIAHDASGAQAILTQEIDGKPYYYSYIITHKNQPWDSLDELVAESNEVDFAFGSISSTSGSLIPGLELQDREVFVSEGEHDFASVRYTGSHDVTAKAVINQDVDAGAIDSAILNELVEDGTVNEEDFKIIWESEELYQYPWTVPAEMDEETIKEVQNAFTSIEDEEILSIFGGASSFIETDHSYYEDITKAAEEFGMLDMDTLEE